MIRININIDGDVPGNELVKIGLLAEALPNVSEITGQMTPTEVTLKITLLNEENTIEIEADWNDFDEIFEAVYIINYGLVKEVKSVFNLHPLNSMGGLDWEALAENLKAVIQEAHEPTAKQIRFDIISPDGFSIHREKVWDTPRKAEEAFDEWLKRFQPQGYYSTIRGGMRDKILLEELRYHCEMKAVLGVMPWETEEETE